VGEGVNVDEGGNVGVVSWEAEFMCSVTRVVRKGDVRAVSWKPEFVSFVTKVIKKYL
jgi:hypothetical protein